MAKRSFQAFGDRETLPVSGFPCPILPDWLLGQAKEAQEVARHHWGEEGKRKKSGAKT